MGVDEYNRVSVIGMGMSIEDLTERHLDEIRMADLMVAGKRHLSELAEKQHLSGTTETLPITSDIEGVVSGIRSYLEQGKRVVTLASGDPLFYGIGTTLIRHLGREKVVVRPNITSVGAAFSKIGETWDDAVVVSLHGKTETEPLVAALYAGKTTAVLTGTTRTPSWVARFLMTEGFDSVRLCILEQLGSDQEKVEWYSPETVAGKDFSAPNIVIVKSPSGNENSTPKRKLKLGSPEEWFQHQNGLITKSEVRAVALSKLDLKPDSVFWDLGAGSGSVAVEASLFIKRGSISAVEKEADRIQDIKENCSRFGLTGVTILQRELPDSLDELPTPDRVFIGGGGKNLGEIITGISQRMGEGIVVVNTVILGSVEAALSGLKSEGFTTEIVQVNISVGHDMPWGEMLKSHNPVWIIKGVRKDGGTNGE